MEDDAKKRDGELMHPVTTFPVIEERLDVSKRIVETGAVRVRTETVETAQRISLKGVAHRANVSREVFDREVTEQYEPRQEGSDWVIPVFEYRPVVEMRLFLKEEVRISLEVSETDSVEEVLVKHQRVVAERRESLTGEWQEIPIPSKG